MMFFSKATNCVVFFINEKISYLKMSIDNYHETINKEKQLICKRMDTLF